MIQVKLPSAGASLKSGGGGEIFMNPQRDIAHAFSFYVLKTFEQATNPDTLMSKWFFASGGLDTDLVVAAKFFRKFIEITEGQTDVKTLSEAAKLADYDKIPHLAKVMIGGCMMNVVLSAFFHGFREAHSKPCDPSIEIKIRETGWIKKTLRSILRNLLYRLS